jgi:hypothetical protein
MSLQGLVMSQINVLWKALNCINDLGLFGLEMMVASMNEFLVILRRQAMNKSLKMYIFIWFTIVHYYPALN